MGWDDALDVWGVYGVGGVLGTILLGVFAAKAVNPTGGGWIVQGNTSFFLKQVTATLGACVYAFSFTWVMLVIINKITPV